MANPKRLLRPLNWIDMTVWALTAGILNATSLIGDTNVDWMVGQFAAAAVFLMIHPYRKYRKETT